MTNLVGCLGTRFIFACETRFIDCEVDGNKQAQICRNAITHSQQHNIPRDKRGSINFDSDTATQCAAVRGC